MDSKYRVLFGGIVCFASLMAVVACNNSKKAPSGKSDLSAIERLEERLVKAPSYENHVNLGLELAKSGRGKEALAIYKKATSINPKAPLAWNNICAELNSQKRFVEAAKNCRKAVEREPKFALAQNNLKIAERQIAKLKRELVGKKNRVLNKANVKSQVLIDLGMDIYSVNDFEGSIAVWAKVRQGDPLFAIAQNNIASSYILLEKFAEAETALGIALNKEPKNQLFINNRKWLQSARSK